MGEETEDNRFYVLANGHGENILRVSRRHLRGPPESFIPDYIDRPIVAFTEMRQNFWSFQPDSWITYHVSTILEVDCPGRDKLFILVERVDDRLEIMLGVGYIPRSFMLEFRATGTSRKSDRCFQQPRQMVAPNVTMRRFLEWVGTSLSRRWQPYHILQSNCQHVSEDVQGFIRDPNNFHSSMEINIHDIELAGNGRQDGFVGAHQHVVQPVTAFSPPRAQTWEAPFRGSPQVIPQPPPHLLQGSTSHPHLGHRPGAVGAGPVIKLKNMPQQAHPMHQAENDECSIM